jgi:hypothetical protein
MHMCVSESVLFLFLHHLRLLWGWLACPSGNPAESLVLLYLLPSPLLSNHWLLFNHVRDSLPLRHGYNIKQLLKYRGFEFVVSKASGRSL